MHLQGTIIWWGRLIVRSFIRSFFAGRAQPTLDPSAVTFRIGPMRQPMQGEKGIW